MRAQPYLDDDLPQLDPIISYELMDYGWRGLTQQGEVLEVKTGNSSVPEGDIVVMCAGRAVGRRAIGKNQHLDIDGYLEHFNRAVALYKQNDLAGALVSSDAALAVAPTLRATFNRAMVLLASGDWERGMREYELCEREDPFTRPQVREALALGLRPWRGEDVAGKRLALLHAHGFGDSIMMLRYLPQVKALGAVPVMVVPLELARLAAQHGTVTQSLQDLEVDFFCPILHLLLWLNIVPHRHVSSAAYLAVDPDLIERWGDRVEDSPNKKIGIAWSVGKPSAGDYPRPIPLAELVMRLGGADLYSMQIQGSREAAALGVRTLDFEDFADCAAAMLQMDEIVSVDTAALHLAGAIGHPEVTALLSHWASWRWVAPWYDMRICRQLSPGDWTSALARC